LIELTGSDVTAKDVYSVATEKVEVKLSAKARESVKSSRTYLEKRLAANETIYGVNTGFGALSDVRINPEDLAKLQINILRSHSSGVGNYFSPAETRAIMFLRANALARPHSATRPEVIDKILELLNADILPVIPQQGSVGASGDLAPLAHLALGVIGEGECFYKGSIRLTAEVLKEKKIVPLKLESKEGLSLINGCQVMTGVGILTTLLAREIVLLADVAGAMTVEAMQGTRKAFDAVIAPTRPHPGENETAANLRKILGETSEIGNSHANCKKVQDAYSLRCMPAVHGATKNTLKNTLRTLEIESNSSTDNPLVFAKEDKILSCGNFHGEPVAFAMDYLAVAMTALGAISERRIDKLTNSHFSGLSPFLAPKSGINSGLMIVQYAAASLVSENQVLAHPASVASLPTSAGKEDHVSMGTIAARKCGNIVENVKNIIAMELLCAAQALDLLKPLKPSAGVLAAYNFIRKEVPFAQEDRIFSNDIKKIAEKISDSSLLKAVEKEVGTLAL
jgi:histidine ammonia-lyase